MGWVKLTELDGQTILDNRRVRYRGTVLGYIKSAWNRGIWLMPKIQREGPITPWFPPDGKTIADVAEDLEVEK